MVAVIVLVLLAISLSVAVPSAKNEVIRRKETELRFILGEFRRAVSKFREKHGRLPQGFAELLRDSDGTPFLRRLYIDPFTGKADWNFTVENDKVIVSSRSKQIGLNGVPYSQFR